MIWLKQGGGVYKVHLQCPRWPQSACFISQGRHQGPLTGVPRLTRRLGEMSLRYAITSYGCHSFLFILHLVIKHKSQSCLRRENSNLWKTLVASLTHTAYKHAVDGRMLSVTPMQNCQADEKSAALSKNGVSPWLKLTCRPTEHFSPGCKLVTKWGSTFVLMEGNWKPV